MKEYEHGGDVESFAKEINCKVEKVIDLSSNINHLKPNINTNFNNLDVSSYPKYDTLYEKVSKKFNIKKSSLELFNGGSSAIFSLFRHLDLKHCTIYAPCYLEYKKASKLFSYKTTFINRFEDIYKTPKKNSLVVFVNPSTPDGKHYEIESLLKIWKNCNCTVLIDESFLEFTSKESSLKHIKKYKKLYILKSMTKFYSNAGIRIGALISSKRNIIKLKENEPLWKLSTFDTSYLLEALKDKKHTKKTKKELFKNKDLLIKSLQKYNFIEIIYPSDANFLLIKLHNKTAKELQEHLKNYKIMIRDCSNFDFLDDKFIRIAIKDERSIKKLIKAFDVL